MICISFQIHNLYIDVSPCSENKKNCGLKFFRIKLQSSIYLQSSDICLQKVVICWPSNKVNHEKYAINYCMSFKEFKVLLKSP